MIRREADVFVFGSGIAAWAAAWELCQRARRPVLVPLAAPAGGRARRAAIALGTGTFLEAAERLGVEAARALWELGREEAAAVRETCRRFGGAGRWRGDGGFVFASTRNEARALADDEDALRDEGFPGEFLDHYMLEARFDVGEIAAAYWSADEGDYDAGFVHEGLRRRALDAGARELPPASRVEVTALHAVAEAGGAEWRSARAVVAPEPDEVPALVHIGLGAAPVATALARAYVPEGPRLPSPARRLDERAGWSGDVPREAWRKGGGDEVSWLAANGIPGAGDWPRTPVAYPGDGRPVLGRAGPALVIAWSASSPATAWPLVIARLAVELALGGEPSVPAPLRPRT